MEQMMDRLLKILDIIETQARSINHLDSIIESQAAINIDLARRLAALEDNDVFPRS
jgi:hypothetical protein